MIELIRGQIEHIEHELNDAKRTYHELDSPLDHAIRTGLRIEEELGNLTTSVGCYVVLTDEAFKCANKAMEDIQNADLPPVIDNNVFQIKAYKEVAGNSIVCTQTNINDAYPLGKNISSNVTTVAHSFASLGNASSVQGAAQRAHKAIDQAKDTAKSHGFGQDLRGPLDELSARSLKLATEGLPNLVDFITDGNDVESVLYMLSDFKGRSERSVQATYRAAGTEHLAMLITHLSIACSEIGKEEVSYFKELGTRLGSCIQLYRTSKKEKAEIGDLIDKALEANQKIFLYL